MKARVDLTPTFEIDTFSAGQVVFARAEALNTVYKVTNDGRTVATQRPGVNIFIDASATVAQDCGRGIHYWEAVDKTYIAHYNKVYVDDYGTSIVTGISNNTERVDFFEIGDYLVLLDYKGGNGYYINSATPTTMNQITDLDFPPRQTPALTMAIGGAVLNETLYVPTTNGQLWNCAVEDPTTWAATDFITAEVSKDGGIMAFLHNQHVVFLGNRTIEFFYDAANPSGSPLAARTDITIDVGGVFHPTFWSDMDKTYFVGTTASGGLGVFVLDGFNLRKISTKDFDSMLTTAVNVDLIELVGSGFNSGGHSYYILTFVQMGGVDIFPAETYVFDNEVCYGRWNLCVGGICHFPVIDWTKSGASQASNGILYNGDILEILDDYNPVDSALTDDLLWVEAGWVEAGWVSNAGVAGSNIDIEILTGLKDFGTMDYKYCRETRLVTEQTPNVNEAINVTVGWANEAPTAVIDKQTLDIRFMENTRFHRGGRFRKRSFRVKYEGPARIELEALELDLAVEQ